MQLVNVEVKETISGMRRYATFRDIRNGNESVMDFGTLLLTPEQKTREIYNNSDLVDEEVIKIYEILT